MTLVVGLVCTDGIVVASDSQQTISGMPLMRQSKEEPKIKILGPNLIFAGAGSLGPLQEIEEKVALLAVRKESICAHDIVEEVRQIVHSVTKDHYERIKALGAPIEDMSSLPTGHIILASYESPLRIYEIMPDGYCERHSRYCALGSSVLYAELILKDYYRTNMNCQDGVFLAYFTIRQASEVDQFVGGPIQINLIRAGKIESVAKEDEMMALEDDFTFRKKVLQDLFSRWPKLAPKIFKILEEDNKSKGGE